MKYRVANLALKVSRVSEHPKYKLGAIIEYRGMILGVGVNKCKTHPRSHSFTTHAELSAILNARDDLKGATIYVARENFYGMANAKPCPACQALLREVGIKEMFFTTTGGWESERL